MVDVIPLAVITVREPVADHPWVSERWRVQGVVAGPVSASGHIERSLLRSGPEGEQYLWTGLVLRLHKNESDSYYYNLVGQNPQLYVYCLTDDDGEPRPHAVTADYIDAMSHAETGNVTHAVPMPPEVYRCIERYVLEHYTPAESKMKRKHEREPNVGGIWDDG